MSDPDEVMRVLRGYHAGLGELITATRGTLERFVGDGLLVVFNDPIPWHDHTERAARMALDMRACVAGLAHDWRTRGHNLGFGVGISRGIATLGSIGFERRAEYSVIGTVLNLAARLCEAAKPGQILVSRRVYSAVEHVLEAAHVRSRPQGLRPSGWPTTCSGSEAPGEYEGRPRRHRRVEPPFRWPDARRSSIEGATTCTLRLSPPDGERGQCLALMSTDWPSAGLV